MTIIYPQSQKNCFSFISLISVFAFLLAFCISTSVRFFSLYAWSSACLACFSASSCFFCACSTASTDDWFTCICNLEFRSRTSFISSSSCSCSLLLIKPFLFLRSSLLCCKYRLSFRISDNSAVIC